MNRETTNYFIKIPYELIRNTDELNIRPGIVMAYCWLRRNATIDGKVRSTLDVLLSDLNLTYYGDKRKEYPKQLKLVLKGIDYLCNNGYCILTEGDYHYLKNTFKLHFNNDFLKEKPFIPLDLSDFKYVLDLEKKSNKTALLFVLAWIKSNFISKNNDNYTACSYSLDTMSEYMGISRVMLFRYLVQLSDDQDILGKSNKPLIRSKNYYYAINDNHPIRFPNIYVENTELALKVIEWKKDDIKNRLYSNLKSKNKNIDFGIDESQLTEMEENLFG